MKQTQRIHTALKKVLRKQGKSYAQVAEVLELSEASVKRLFSTASLSLLRLEKICDWLKIDIADLVGLSEDEKPFVTHLSDAQEAHLLNDMTLLLITFLVLNNWSTEEICKTYALSKTALFRYLVKLEKLGLVEILPFDRVKLRAARNFSWGKDGPIQQFFAREVMPEFLATRFDEPGEKMQFVGGMLSRSSVLVLHEKIDALAKTLDELVTQDINIDTEERYGASLFIGFRPWEFSRFTQLRRVERSKFF